VGEAQVLPPSGKKDYRVKSYEVYPEQAPKAGKAGLPGSTALFTDLRAGMQQTEMDAIVFLHGYASTFDSALERAAEISGKYTIKSAPAAGGRTTRRNPFVFAFCWPSDGEMVPWKSWHSDRQDAALSGIAMARSLMRLLDFLRSNKDARCQQRIHLVAHSMGNWALRNLLLSLRTLNNDARLPRIFDQMFLMAADEDNDAFEHQAKLALLSQLATAIHVYYAENDRALDISDMTKGQPDRLGETGPRTMDGIDSRVFAIDCRNVCETTLADANHQYYRKRKEVIADVCAVLDGATPDQIKGREVIQPGRRYRISA
jgi:esterase/lipase superfamily enzyme